MRPLPCWQAGGRARTRTAARLWCREIRLRAVTWRCARLVANGVPVQRRHHGGHSPAPGPVQSAPRVRPSAALLAQTFAAVHGASVAKILFTSGSTGTPKGVINTHEMLCANQQTMRQACADSRCIGDPPGVTVKLVPADDDTYEIRVSGTLVTPGYFRRPDLAEHSFDAEGFYCLGDAVSSA